MSINPIDEQIVHNLFKLSYTLTSLKYVTADGKDYHNRKNMWDHGKDGDQECCGYYDCEFDLPEDPEGSIDYTIDYKFDIIDEEDFEELEPEKVAKINAILHGDRKAKLFDLPEGTTISIVNLDGFNYDHRGSNHTAIRLDYHDYYELNNNNLESLIEALYRIKSHKFDKWYELYTGISRIVRQDDALEISVCFDHGS